MSVKFGYDSDIAAAKTELWRAIGSHEWSQINAAMDSLAIAAWVRGLTMARKLSAKGVLDDGKAAAEIARQLLKRDGYG